ncbi:FAD-dependent oxidoreductase [Streptomyces sp. NPDC051664]|uniref:FAD-dependent oxidoreductase n=1 Tax=Streptomyces sp. NPDC051664 TaxID=3365668 RepID=UPI0037A19DBF
MRIAVVGGGLLGALLAWRLATVPRDGERPRIDLWTGSPRRRDRDATSSSGGMVRAFETSPRDSALAALGLAELRSDAALRDWAEFREVGSVVVRSPGADADASLRAVEAVLPGQAELVDLAGISRMFPFRGLPRGSYAVVERRAGHVSPDRLRDAVLARLPVTAVNRLACDVARVDAAPSVCPVGGTPIGYEMVVLATGPWTPALLARSGLDGTGYRTKQIEYTRFTGWPDGLGVFVDETSGLYGRPTGPGTGILGVPTDRWDVRPSAAVVDRDGAERLLDAVRTRLPGTGPSALRPAAVGVRCVAAVDCYHDTPGVTLRAVSSGEGLFTFTGGSGGAVKTALAASREATRLLLGAASRPSPGLPPFPAPGSWRA